jgi:hypothetical protein
MLVSIRAREERDKPRSAGREITINSARFKIHVAPANDREGLSLTLEAEGEEHLASGVRSGRARTMKRKAVVMLSAEDLERIGREIGRAVFRATSSTA